MLREGPKTQKTTPEQDTWRTWPGNDITEQRAHPKGTDQVDNERTHKRAGARTGRQQGDHVSSDSAKTDRPRDRQCEPVCSGALLKIARAFSL